MIIKTLRENIKIEITWNNWILNLSAEAYVEPYQTSNMRNFAEIVNGLKLLFSQKAVP